MNRRKTTVMEVPHGWMRFLAGMAVLMFCLSLFCSNAWAVPVPYEVNNVGAGPQYGLSSSGDLTVPEPNYYFGLIRVDANSGDGAYAIYSDDGNITMNSFPIDGCIEAKVDVGSFAYGLYSTSGWINTNDISGTIDANAVGDRAYGMFAHDYITTGVITGNITATAGTNYAYGLYSENGDITTDAIDGNIVATAGGDSAYGMFAHDDITTGAITGNISATAGDSGAYGLNSGGVMDIGDFYYGTISAEATAGSGAYGLKSASDMTVDSIAYGASISATAGIDNAYGLNSGGTLHIGDMYYSTISAEATAGSGAYGLYSSSDMTVDSMYGADINATAGTDKAVGLYSDAGSVNIGAMYGNGNIIAHAGGDYAYGILSYGPMIVTIYNGEVSAVADGGTHAAAIQSGRFGDSVDSQSADDLVTIYAGSTIVGDINLANGPTSPTPDNDTLNLVGYSNAYSTTLNDNIVNVEDINITGGTWHINGDVYNNANGTTVNGGILKGTGTLENLYVKDGGTLNPGNSIGSMTIDGDLTIGSEGIYEVDVNNDGSTNVQADNVKVSGTADLQGTIRVNAFDRHLFDVNVLDAGSLVEDHYPDVSSNNLFLQLEVEYIGDPCVWLHGSIDYTTFAETDNQYSVGEAFNYIVDEGLDTNDMDVVLTALENLDDGDAANKAYDQIMPQDALGLADIIRNAMNQYSESIFGRMSNIRNSRQYAMAGDSRYLLASAGNSLALPPKTDEWMPFAKGFGVRGDRNAESDIAGYQYNIYGMAGSVDKLVSDNTLIGLSVAGSRASVDYSQSGTSANIDSIFCSLYGSYFVDDWHVGVTLGYGHSWYDSQRSIPFIGREAKSDHQGNAYSAAVELGQNFGGTEMLLEPVAGIGYTVVQESGYTEKGADALNLKVDSETTDGLYGKLGVRIAKEFRCDTCIIALEQNQDVILVPNVSAFWIHDFADRVELNSSFIGGGSFTTEGLEPLRDTFNIGAGLNIYYDKSLQLFVDYGWQSASSFNSDTVQLGAQWSF